MKNSNLYQVIEGLNKFAPPEIAAFDFAGLLVDSDSKSIRKIGITLDATLTTISEAVTNKCDLLITHHGPDDKTFHEISGLDRKRIALALSANLPIFRMHLNLDFCTNGNSETLCKLLGFEKFKPTWTIYQGHKLETGAHFIDGYFLLEDLLERVKRLIPNSVRIVPSSKKMFKRLAITPGGGFEPCFLEQLPSPDVFISGELNHIAIVRAIDLNICLIEATHASTENEPLKLIAKRLEKFLGIQVVFIESRDNIKVVRL
ncbi:Nif3-like dinuclear metal center hexameric protein [Candidatus Microgenomates bacterium]|nr:Nif3-like dinuclear metal center hexameric protein [Candidatus Microgenomates bacterium]